MIRTSDGRAVTLVQNREDEEPPIPDGSQVLVQYGGDYTRVIAMPPNVEGGLSVGGTIAGSWKNPDLPEESGGSRQLPAEGQEQQ